VTCGKDDARNIARGISKEKSKQLEKPSIEGSVRDEKIETIKPVLPPWKNRQQSGLKEKTQNFKGIRPSRENPVKGKNWGIQGLQPPTE